MSSPTLTAAEREAIRNRLQIWEQAGPLLEEQRWRELQALTSEKALALTKALFSRRIATACRRQSSGLVEQQALFRRLGTR